MNTVMRFIPPDPRDGRIAELNAQIVAQASRIEALEAKLDLAAARHTSRALTEPVAEVAAAIRASPVVHIDETSWTEEKRTAWLWPSLLCSHHQAALA